MDEVVKSPNAGKIMHRPPAWMVLLEATILLEGVVFLVAGLCSSGISKKGDGHTVIVVPGFGMSNRSTRLMRSFLRRVGYNAVGWVKDKNDGLSQNTLDALCEQVEDLSLQSDQLVSLIGWSLGGIYSRLVAEKQPKHIRQLILLASPFNAGGFASPPPSMEKYFAKHDLVPPDQATVDRFKARFHVRPNCASISVYSATDPIASKPFCLDVTRDITENVRIFGSHGGMSINPFVWKIVLNRLRQNHTERTPFKVNFFERLFYKPVTHPSAEP